MSTKSLDHVHLRSVVLPATALGLVAGVLGGLVLLLGSVVTTTRSYVTFVGTATVASSAGSVLLVAVYNAVAGRFGGIRFAVDDAPASPAPPDADIVDEDVVRCPECQGLEHRDRDSCRFCGGALPST